MTLISLMLIAAIVVAYLTARKAVDAFVRRIAREKDIVPGRTQYVAATLKLGLLVVMVQAMAVVAGINFADIGIIFSSLFAVLGVALFAQWSMLSNVTASIIVFFFFPYRPGDTVTIVDGDNSICGKIREITLFHVILDGDDNETLTYPNALVFQKAVKIQSPRTSETPAAAKDSKTL